MMLETTRERKLKWREKSRSQKALTRQLNTSTRQLVDGGRTTQHTPTAQVTQTHTNGANRDDASTHGRHTRTTRVSEMSLR